jgi:putative DNA primase/helicase
MSARSRLSLASSNDAAAGGSAGVRSVQQTKGGLLTLRPSGLELLGPVCISGEGDLASVCDTVEDLLVQASAPVFQRGGMLVRVVHDREEAKGISRDPEAPRILPFDDLSFAELVTRTVEIQRLNRKTKEWSRVDCPRVIAQTILARREWSFRRLEAVIEHPLMLPSGEVLWESQYHAPSGLLLQIPLCTFQAPIESPSDGDLYWAISTLRSLLEGFAFLEDLDESVALAFLLTPFVRPLLTTCPAIAIDAHAPGSGKSTLVRTQARISTGREPAFITYRDDPSELQKLLFAALLEGDQNIAIDNIDIPLASADLAVMLTSPMYRGRVLGQSINASVPTKAVISFNGNNLQIIGDLTRRVLVSRLDPMCERPAERVFEFDPLQEVNACRSEYVLAALTIMSGYISSGGRVDVRPFGSFEDWSRLVREPLVWLGLPDPVDSLRVLEAADPERGQLGDMLRAVHDAFGIGEFKSAHLLAATKGGRQASLDGGGLSLTDQQAEAIQEALRGVCERNGELNAKALGRWLLRVNGRIEGGMRFVQSRQTKVGAMWRVQHAQ